MLLVSATLLFLLSLVSVHKANYIQVVNHIPGSDGIGLLAQPIHTTLVLTLQRGIVHESWTELVQVRFLRELSDALHQDQCRLSFSGVTLQQVVLKLFCPHTMDNNTETDDVPLMENMRALLAQWQFDVVPIAVNKPIRHPSQWYGGGDDLELVMRNYKRGQAWSRPNYHNNAVEMPAPWGLDRID